MRGITDSPTTSCISGVTGRGFIIPRGSLVLVVDDGSEDDAAAVAEVTARTMRMLAGREEIRRDGELRNGAVSTRRKVEKVPEESAIVVFRRWVLCCVCVVVELEDREVLLYPFFVSFFYFSSFYVINRLV